MGTPGAGLGQQGFSGSRSSSSRKLRKGWGGLFVPGLAFPITAFVPADVLDGDSVFWWQRWPEGTVLTTFLVSLLSQLQAQKLRLAYTRSSHYGGSLPNVNQIGCGLAEFQVSGHQPRSAGSRAASPADSPVLLAEPPSFTFGFISEHSAPWVGGAGTTRPPQNGVPTPPVPPPHIL